VVGEQVFAAEVHVASKWKQYDDLHRCSVNHGHITAFKMTESTMESCISLVKSLGLRYAAVDFIKDKDDRLIFLEANPTGDWYWIENHTKLPITKAMVDLIAGLV
jgi:glutathione synthase/RimK-type ligase-like ATP-grasp enzyme